MNFVGVGGVMNGIRLGVPYTKSLAALSPGVQALWFDGIDDYAYFSTATMHAMAGKDMTKVVVTGRLRVDASYSTARKVIQYGAVGSSQMTGFYLRQNSATTLQVIVGGQSYRGGASFSTGDLTPDTWYDFTIDIDTSAETITLTLGREFTDTVDMAGPGFTIFNGTYVSKESIEGHDSTTPSFFYSRSSDGANMYWGGVMSDVKIVDRNGTVLHRALFDDGSGTALADGAAGASDGTLVSADPATCWANGYIE